VTELKETWAARGRLDPRDPLVLKERKEQREKLESRVRPAKRDSKGTKATVELLGCLHTSTGRSAPGKKRTAKIQARYLTVIL